MEKNIVDGKNFRKKILSKQVDINFNDFTLLLCFAWRLKCILYLVYHIPWPKLLNCLCFFKKL